ncbi:uncharacterized protein LOC141851928 [Brevipalpus obovatus]|uniref:uncharacterized protein LOC141851928 n=1 Tax=Brevipalpus obovatus TaxID=246614 RepID=UPI003D9DF9D3
MPYEITVDAFTQTVPKICEQACQAVAKVEEKGCQTVVGPIVDKYAGCAADDDDDDRIDNENIPQENFRNGVRNFHHHSSTSRSPRRVGIENRKHSSSKSDSDDKAAVKIVYNTDPNDSNTPSESSALIREPKDSQNDPMTDDETLELTGNVENSGHQMHEKNSGTPKTPMKKVGNREDNGVELDHQGEHPLKLDNCNLQYANGRPFQVYCQGRSISKADQQLILNDLIEERKPSNMYKCKYHTDCKDPQGNHISKKNVQLHISRFIFTFRCRACSHKSSTSSNFLKHMRRCK